MKYRLHTVPTYLGESLVTSLGPGGALLTSVQGTLQEVTIHFQHTAQYYSTDILSTQYSGGAVHPFRPGYSTISRAGAWLLPGTEIILKVYTEMAHCTLQYLCVSLTL